MIPVISSEIKQENGGILAEVEYGAKAENLGFLFDILRNQLYKDPITAVIREYSTNAIDAHIMAGKKELPIKVTFPTLLQPTLKIRDFGAGLSDNEIRTIFASYGESSKRLTQDATGMLGIGCKSGFAYCDSFMVNSYKDGQLSVWTSFIDPSRKGQLNLMCRVPTEEPNGLEIEIAIKADDADKFISKGVNLFKFYKTIPDCEGLPVNQAEYLNSYKAKKPLFASDAWRFIGDGTESIAIMGNIPYPIEMDVFGSGELTIDLQAILARGIHIEFPNGSLEFAASREALRYTEHTKKVIIDTLKAISTEIGKLLQEKFVVCQTLWDAKILYSELFGNTSTPFFHLKSIFSKNCSFNGKPINDSYFSVSHTGVSCTSYAQRGKYSERYNGYKVRAEHDETIIPRKENAIFINDTGITDGLMNRMLPIMLAGPKYGMVYIITEQSLDALKNFREKTGFDYPLVSLSTLVKEPVTKYYPRVKGGSNSKYTENVLVFNPSKATAYRAIDAWDIDENDTEVDQDAGVFVEIQRFQYRGKHDNFKDTANLKSELETLASLGIAAPVIYGLKSPAFAKARNNPKMVPFATWMQAELDKVVTNRPDIAQLYADYVFVHQSSTTYNELYKLNSATYGAGFDQHPLFGKFVANFKILRDTNLSNPFLEAIKELSGRLKINLHAQPCPDLIGLYKEIDATYPLFKFVAGSSSVSLQLKEYVDLVDRDALNRKAATVTTGVALNTTPTI